MRRCTANRTFPSIDSVVKTLDDATVTTSQDPRPTMLDVARLAGVSLKTASRVLNGEPHVAAGTAAKVHTAAGQLAFRLNGIARELRQGARSTSVGLIISDVANPFYARVARGAERRLRSAGLQLITASSDEDADSERKLTAELLERRVCGLLITTCLSDHAHLETERRLGIPVTFLDRPPVGIVADTVAIDNEVGARLAAQHLLDQGHRRIGLIGDLSRLTTHRERVAGFQSALTEAGVDDWERYVRADSHDSESAGRSVRALMALKQPPTALFTTNNRITIGALRALRDRARPPALVGFDDFELADLLGVTVISHAPEDMGAIGADLLLARLDGSSAGAHSERLPVRLIERGSGERPPA
ncbi:MAG: Transcriptional regulator, LacI family [Jatrophihabitans sp.]|jgi:LacI family transcriptional regulator|nr:Transcriptional regulator, LacI family [Jatrophihabitans sp.]